MRTFAITGIETAAWMPSIMLGSDMRATPPSRRMSDGTRSSAITETAPAASAIFACSGSTTSMMTPPLSISASPVLTRRVAVSFTQAMLAARGAWPASINGRLCEQLAQLGGDPLGLVVEAAPGDPYDQVAGSGKSGVAASVFFKGLCGVVGAAAVQLDDQAVIGPEAIRFV